MIPSILNEHEAFTNLIESLKVAEACCRQLMYIQRGIVGHETKARGWAIAAGKFGELRERCTQLATATIRAN